MSRYSTPRTRSGRSLTVVIAVIAIVAGIVTLSQSNRNSNPENENTTPALNHNQVAVADTMSEPSSLDRIITAIKARNGDVRANFCFAPGTDRDVINEFCSKHPELCGWSLTDGPRYDIADRWPGLQGSPRELTWSLVPDGTIVDGHESTLFADMDAMFGFNRAAWIGILQDCLERWGELTGLNYTRVTYGGNDWDDGAEWGWEGDENRGDVRIAMIPVDGESSVLAYNHYPSSGGDMVLDQAENWGDATSNFVFLRNVVMHEHGHGIGIQHKCPVRDNTLMEPYYSPSFSGPQHDDIRAAQRHYGDPYESNNSFASATPLGTVSYGNPASLGTPPSPSVNYGSVLSIDDNGEQDWFSFTVTEESRATVIVTPIGHEYEDTTQTCMTESGCCYGEFTQSLSVANLAVQLYGQDGSSVLAMADSEPAGTPETIVNTLLPGGAGTFYVRVFETSYSQTQLYSIQVSVAGADQDIDPPTPDPAVILDNPLYTYGSGPGAVTMTAQAATDATPPIEYYFDSVSSGGHDRDWSTSTVYTDTGLNVNSLYSYRVRAKDSEDPANYTDIVNAPQVQICTGCYIPGQPSVNLGTPPESAITLSLDTNGNPAWTNFAIECINSDDEMWAGKFIAEDGSPSDTAVWRRPSQWGTVSLSDLQACSEYTFAVKARNLHQVETTYGTSGSVTTEGCSATCATSMADANGDAAVDALDIQCFIDCMVSSGTGCSCACGDFETPSGVGMEDVADFVNALLDG